MTPSPAQIYGSATSAMACEDITWNTAAKPWDATRNRVLSFQMQACGPGRQAPMVPSPSYRPMPWNGHKARADGRAPTMALARLIRSSQYCVRTHITAQWLPCQPGRKLADVANDGREANLFSGADSEIGDRHMPQSNPQRQNLEICPVGWMCQVLAIGAKLGCMQGS